MAAAGGGNLVSTAALDNSHRRADVARFHTGAPTWRAFTPAPRRTGCGAGWGGPDPFIYRQPVRASGPGTVFWRSCEDACDASCLGGVWASNRQCVRPAGLHGPLKWRPGAREPGLAAAKRAVVPGLDAVLEACTVRCRAHVSFSVILESKRSPRCDAGSLGPRLALPSCSSVGGPLAGRRVSWPRFGPRAGLLQAGLWVPKSRLRANISGKRRCKTPLPRRRQAKASAVGREERIDARLCLCPATRGNLVSTRGLPSAIHRSLPPVHSPNAFSIPSCSRCSCALA